MFCSTQEVFDHNIRTHEKRSERRKFHYARVFYQQLPPAADAGNVCSLWGPPAAMSAHAPAQKSKKVSSADYSGSFPQQLRTSVPPLHTRQTIGLHMCMYVVVVLSLLVFPGSHRCLLSLRGSCLVFGGVTHASDTSCIFVRFPSALVRPSVCTSFRQYPKPNNSL